MPESKLTANPVILACCFSTSAFNEPHENLIFSFSSHFHNYFMSKNPSDTARVAFCSSPIPLSLPLPLPFLLSLDPSPPPSSDTSSPYHVTWFHADFLQRYLPSLIKKLDKKQLTLPNSKSLQEKSQNLTR